MYNVRKKMEQRGFTKISDNSEFAQEQKKKGMAKKMKVKHVGKPMKFASSYPIDSNHQFHGPRRKLHGREPK